MIDHRQRLTQTLAKARTRLLWGTVEEYPRAMVPVRLRDAEVVLEQLAAAEEQVAQVSKLQEALRGAADRINADDKIIHNDRGTGPYVDDPYVNELRGLAGVRCGNCGVPADKWLDVQCFDGHSHTMG